jgi:hypothetical protein
VSAARAAPLPFLGGAVRREELRASAIRPEHAQGPVPAHLLPTVFREPETKPRADPSPAPAPQPEIRQAGPPRRSRTEAMRAYLDSLTPEERQERETRALGAARKALTREHRFAFGRHGGRISAQAPPEERQARARKAAESRKANGTEAIVLEAARNGSKKLWAEKSVEEKKQLMEGLRAKRWAAAREVNRRNPCPACGSPTWRNGRGRRYCKACKKSFTPTREQG